MRKGIYLATTMALTTAMLACSEQPNFDETTALAAAESFSNRSAECDQLGKAIDPAQIKIEGRNIAYKGEALNYRLSEAGGCLDSKDVAWKTISDKHSLEQSTEFNSVFSKAGTYTISAMVDTGTSEPTMIAFNTAVVSDQPIISGPEVALNNRFIEFQLALPQAHNYVSAEWDFGDSSAREQSLGEIAHVYASPGSYSIQVQLVDDKGATSSVRHSITVVEGNDNVLCADEIAMSVPTEITQGVAAGFSVFIPSCLSSQVTAVRWNFGDGSEISGNQSTEHTYTDVGSYTVSVELYLRNSTQPWVTLVREVQVQEAAPGEVVPEQPEDPAQEDGSENIGLACKRPGQTRETFGEIYTDLVACEMDGIQRVSYRDRITEECKVNANEILIWTEVSRTAEVQSEGVCEARSCTLPNGSVLSHGESAVLYKTPLPEGSCAAVSVARTCNDGTLEGPQDHAHMSCQEGCTGFGSNGAVKTAVETGTVVEPLACGFGEQGYSNVYKEVSDKTCNLGTVVSSNTRKGDLVSAGSCPTYNWQASNEWSTCSADCGGSQQQVHVCVSSEGKQVADGRCGGAQPEVSRVCDGNPEAVRRQDVTTEKEEQSSQSCPADQIGTVTKARELYTTKTYACIDHKVQLESTVFTEGEWTSTPYCRDYVARRCSHDSLNNTGAAGRVAWIKRCQDKNPMLKEYVDKMGGYKIKDSARRLYPTFLDSSTSPEKTWVAPHHETDSCETPEGVYIAAVCVSSCSTPEQQIMVSDDKKSLKYKSFIDALTENTPFVATLPRASTMQTKRVHASSVEQWVTELMDTEHEIINFTMASGRTLRVTTNHPIVAENGRMKLAADFKVGDSLVELGGKLDQIVSLESESYFGKVYNLFVVSADPRQNIVVINGYLNGSAFFQNEGAKHMNRTIFRSNLLRGIFE